LVWLGKWFLFQTFDELDKVKDKDFDEQQIHQLFEDKPNTSEVQK
jgi:hypothetical protein